MARSYQIDTIGGNCPVQAEGRIGGRTKFYFRARGDRWSMSIGGRDLIGDPDWYFEEDYGVWPDAGWMPVEEARQKIDQAIKLYWSKVPSMAARYRPLRPTRA